MQDILVRFLIRLFCNQNKCMNVYLWWDTYVVLYLGLSVKILHKCQVNKISFAKLFANVRTSSIKWTYSTYASLAKLFADVQASSIRWTTRKSRSQIHLLMSGRHFERLSHSRGGATLRLGGAWAPPSLKVLPQKKKKN
jgi:hypothetical protein